MEFRLSDLDDETLLREYEKSLKGLRSLNFDVPDWVREVRVMYHHYLINELVRRRGLTPLKQLAHS